MFVSKLLLLTPFNLGCMRHVVSIDLLYLLLQLLSQCCCYLLACSISMFIWCVSTSSLLCAAFAGVSTAAAAWSVGAAAHCAGTFRAVLACLYFLLAVQHLLCSRPLL
jgi:hypothetical protein